MKPPIAEKRENTYEIHGYEVSDEYSWLRDREEEKDPKVIEYLNSENEYTEHVMSEHQSLTDKIYDEIVDRIQETDESVPYKKGDYWYFHKTNEGSQYPVYCRAKNFEKEDSEVMLDQNELAEGHEFYSLGRMTVSDCGRYLAYSYDTTGYRQYTLAIKDLETGETLKNKVERVVSIVWSADSDQLFYVQEDEETKRNDTFWRYTVSSDNSELIRTEDDVLFNMWASRSRDRKYVFLQTSAATMDEIRYLEAEDPTGVWNLVLEREEGHEYGVDHRDGYFYITTNKEAKDFRICRLPVSGGVEEWVDFVPAQEGLKIEGIDLFEDFAVVSELENGLEYLRVFDFAKDEDFRVETPESVYTMGIGGGNAEFSTPTFRYTYASMITPGSVYEYDVDSRTSKLLKQDEVLGGYDKSEYVTERVWAEARDGVKVPISLVMKKGTKLDGSSPLHLYAYGSYGITVWPRFSHARLSVIERGMIYAIAHIRGGSLLGEPWRHAGRLDKKLNTFHDFIDCAEWLCKNDYTSPDRLVAEGGSAGGLLMGGVVNMSPKSFRAAIVAVPFVDVLNTMLDETLPLTTQEWIEWGNPNEKEAYDYMRQYSPYDNLTTQDYPDLLVLTSLWDSQVGYWEAAKFVARLRALNEDSSGVLLKTNMDGGHGGSSGRYDRFKEIAFEYAFSLSRVGITE